MNVVYARTGVVIVHDGQRVQIRAGEPWLADDPLVASHPELFVDGHCAARTTRDPRGYCELPIECATSGPGERRVIRRKDTSRA